MLENDDHIPYGTKVGNVFSDPKGELISNFWKDEKHSGPFKEDNHELLRRTTMSNYVNDSPSCEPGHE